jgi:hypothetical protein
MKKILFWFLVCIFASSFVFSQTREYEDWYLLSSPFTEGCIGQSITFNYELDLPVDPFSVYHPMRPYIFEGCSILDSKTFPFHIVDKAQYYNTEEPIKIAGVAALFYRRGFGKMHGYLCITDDSLNVLRRAKLESYFDTIDGKAVEKDASDHYVELFFDSSISVNGDFYVMIDCPKPPSLSSIDYNWTEETTSGDDFPLGFYKVQIYQAGCSNTKNFLLSREFVVNATEAEKMCLSSFGIENEGKWIKLNTKTLYVFPILADTTIVDTTDSSSLVNIVDNYTFIFPNPTSKEVNIQCSFRMQALELFNEQGQKVNEWKVDSYHYLLNVEDYPKGNYVMKIKTKSGTTTKKVIVQ